MSNMSSNNKLSQLNTAANIWYCYFVRCNDNSLYAGITTDLKKRLLAHNSEKNGAKYTRYKQPVSLVYYTSHQSRSAASKQEYQLKQLTKKQKETLVENFPAEKLMLVFTEKNN